MGADNFVVYFGLRYEIASLAEQEALDGDADPRVAAARAARLRTYAGRLTDGAPKFLLIGTLLGTFGVQGKGHLALSEAELLRVMGETREKLRKAGLEGEPELHLQFEAQY